MFAIKKNKLNQAILLATVVMGVYSIQGLAADLMTLPQVVESAILTNPEILQSYKTYEAALRETDAASGRYLPSVDLTSSIGLEHRRDPGNLMGDLGHSYSRDQTTLSLRQLIFDGFATKNEVERLDKTSKARLFELENLSQSIALDATKAYVDLLRYRSLTSLAEDNYVAHKTIYEQLQLKAKAGVGKKSDVEQARSRLSLADYNMSVEGSNLHDIESRYQNLVGNLPPKDINATVPLGQDIPKDPVEAIKYAQVHNPKLLATIQDIASQNALFEYRKSAFMPKLDFRARADYGNDINGYSGVHRNEVAEVVMSWNLFNGNTDTNLRKKELSALEAATNRRDKTCRDIRLELQIAYNDINKLSAEASFLDERQIAIEKARDAYRKQFDIGQRTLVDLLNAENEVFEAKRLYTNVVNDITVAKARTQFQMGNLLSSLGLSRFGSEKAPLPESTDGSNIAACPAELAPEYKFNRDELDARAMEVINVKK